MSGIELIAAERVKCHWCAEGRPFMLGQEGLQHVPLYGGGEHDSAMCYNSAIYNGEGAASPSTAKESEKANE